MARKKKSELEAEAATSVPKAPEAQVSDAVEMIDDSAKLIDPSPKVPAKAKKAMPARPTDEELKAAMPPRYLVARGGRIMHRGIITMLRTGKVIRAGDYNIAQLLQQGIALEEIKPE